MPTLSNLPRDVISYLIQFLHSKTIISLGLTSKYFFEITKNQREKDNKHRVVWKIIVWWRLHRSNLKMSFVYETNWSVCITYTRLLQALSNIPNGAKLPTDLLMATGDLYIYTHEEYHSYTLPIYTATPGYIWHLDKDKRSVMFYSKNSAPITILNVGGLYLSHILSIPKRLLN
uniref:F-box domain-containing protein n=1 Tax=Marseillevirus LCMAC102 TaxID=2506603 RepID=A0A481YSK0_9VIRU|nr:MAG: hypothetical protein LCMAC102_00480 [Marseillevirus LCMAC102]